MKHKTQQTRSIRTLVIRNNTDPRYELEEVNISNAKDSHPQELKLNKITTFSLKINNLPKSPVHISAPVSSAKTKLPPISQSVNILDFNLFRPTIINDKPRHNLKAFSISSPKSPNPLLDQKLSPKQMIDITIDPEEVTPLSPSPNVSRRHDSFVNLFIGPKRMESAIPTSATYREEAPLAFKSIHASQNAHPKRLTSTLVRRKEQLEGFVISKVYKFPDNRVTLKECMKPVINTGTKKFVKKIVKNFKPADESPKKNASQRDSAAPLANPASNIERDILRESPEVMKL